MHGIFLNEMCFRFLATYVMAPTAHVIVYYVRMDGEIIADSLDIELTGTLQNFVRYHWHSFEKMI